MSDKATGHIDNLDLVGIGRLANAMLRQLPRKAVIGLVGTLGAGKTTLVQAIAAAADIDTADVTSPTFTLLQSYRGKIVIHHLDAYRVADEDEFLELGVDELFDDDAWTLVEWADRVADVMPANTMWVELRITGEQSRNVTFTSDQLSASEAIGRIVMELKHPSGR